MPASASTSPKPTPIGRSGPPSLPRTTSARPAKKAGELSPKLAKALAAQRGWPHYARQEIRDVIRQIADESLAEPAIRRALLSAESLHSNFYEIHLDRRGAELALEDAAYLMRVLWNLLSYEYTAGRPFDEWASSGDN